MHDYNTLLTLKIHQLIIILKKNYTHPIAMCYHYLTYFSLINKLVIYYNI